MLPVIARCPDFFWFKVRVQTSSNIEPSSEHKKNLDGTAQRHPDHRRNGIPRKEDGGDCISNVAAGGGEKPCQSRQCRARFFPPIWTVEFLLISFHFATWRCFRDSLMSGGGRDGSCTFCSRLRR